MKARLENGKIKLYGSLPTRYRSDNLNIAGGFEKMGSEVHEAEGFFDLVLPVYDNDVEQFGEIYFDEANQVYTYPIEDIILPTLEEAKATKIAELKSSVTELYQSVQAYITEKQIHDEIIPSGVKTKIKSIRLKYNEFKTEINALQTVVEVVKFKLPYDVIENLKSQLEGIE